MVESFKTLSEERYYQQSKRSQYYKDCHKEFHLVKEEIKSSSITSEKNDLYCPQYAGYILNNWTGLASLWSNIHLGCQSKHSREQSYLKWSKTFGNCDCVTNPPRTQGIIELHQKITKHITLSTKSKELIQLLLTESQRRYFLIDFIKSICPEQKKKPNYQEKIMLNPRNGNLVTKNNHLELN